MMRVLLFYLRHVCLWSALVLGAYWLYLDVEIGNSFATRSWTLPGRIYASPQELFVGADISQAALRSVLQRLGYVESKQLEKPGRYALKGQAIELHTRGWQFPDSRELPRRLLIAFRASHVTELKPLSGDPIAIVRLEPEEIGTLHAKQFEDRILLRFDEVPPSFIKYLIAVEDRRFFEHFGVDPLGILRAAYRNMRSGRVTEGGSTITQQLVKNLYLSNKRSWWRKLREAMMAVSLERRFEKNEILEAYINEIFVGQDGNRAIHGFGLAAKFFFGKPLAHLSPQEAAMLVGMVKAPSAYNPRRHPRAAAARRATVLNLLNQRGLLAPSEFATASNAELVVTDGALDLDRNFGAIVELVRQQLRRDYRDEDLRGAGYKVYTTIDPTIQRVTQEAARSVLAQIEVQHKIANNSLQTAAVVVDPRSADIKAVVGGRKGFGGGFDRALNARRPIGSLVKPFVYSSALGRPSEFNVLSMLRDESLTVNLANGDTWTPRNYDNTAHGEVNLRDAFAFSYNLATVNLGMQLGLKTVVADLSAMGVAFDNDEERPSLLLGALELTPYEVTQLYQAIANDGFRIPLRIIRAVSNARNLTLARYPLDIKPVLASDRAFLVRYLMMHAFTHGTGRGAAGSMRKQLPLAGKTGTTNDGRDSWFAGFGANYLGVVWIGRDDNGATGLTGSSGALKIWSELMRTIELAPLKQQELADIEWQWLSANGGAIVADNCPGALRVPLSTGHNLTIDEQCGTTPPVNEPTTAPSGIWDRLKGIFH